MIVHRAVRDIQKCELKYGEAWQEYTRRVPYLFIPVSFDRPTRHVCRANVKQYVF